MVAILPEALEESVPDFIHYGADELPIDATCDERELWTMSGEIEIAEDHVETGQLLVLRPRNAITVKANSSARFIPRPENRTRPCRAVEGAHHP